jgi:hypothetical protein
VTTFSALREVVQYEFVDLLQESPLIWVKIALAVENVGLAPREIGLSLEIMECACL